MAPRINAAFTLEGGSIDEHNHVDVVMVKTRLPLARCGFKRSRSTSHIAHHGPVVPFGLPATAKEPRDETVHQLDLALQIWPGRDRQSDEQRHELRAFLENGGESRFDPSGQLRRANVSATFAGEVIATGVCPLHPFLTEGRTLQELPAEQPAHAPLAAKHFLDERQIAGGSVPCFP